jgi:hypothetical protein
MDLEKVTDMRRSRNRADFWRLILDQITIRRRSLREAVEGRLQAGAPTISHRRDELAETHPGSAVEESFMVIPARLWNLGGMCR